MRSSPLALPALVLLAGLAHALPAVAQDAATDPTPQSRTASSAQSTAFYLQAGASAHSASSLRVGVTLPWQSFERNWLGQQWTGYWDLYAAQWRARPQAAASYRNTTAVGITPTLRMTPSAGRSRWFVDMGIGLVLTDRHYRNHGDAMSTRYNFASQLGLGLWLDQARTHNLTLSIQHVSNASIKKPNPGENFVQLRYSHRF